MRTAGRILGRAAFVSGFWVQDFPVYGTERRGAPVTSYVRFSSEPIQERGTPAWVNLLVKLDATVPYGGRAGLVVVNSSSHISGSKTCDMRSLGSGFMYPTGSSRFRMTGSWRTLRPVVDESRCKSCFLCYVACPEAVISLDGDERPIIDYDNCKGCLICKQVCPFSAIGVEVESS